MFTKFTISVARSFLWLLKLPSHISSLLPSRINHVYVTQPGLISCNSIISQILFKYDRAILVLYICVVNGLSGMYVKMTGIQTLLLKLTLKWCYFNKWSSKRCQNWTLRSGYVKKVIQNWLTNHCKLLYIQWFWWCHFTMCKVKLKTNKQNKTNQTIILKHLRKFLQFYWILAVLYETI